MAGQIQTQEFINGNWVTRHVDIHEIMARTEQQRASSSDLKPKATARCCEEVTAGVLTKTVVQSPHAKLILPARIRQNMLNDVVFIGETALHLKEVSADGSLRHIASKSDFKSKILSASLLNTKAPGGLPDEESMKMESSDAPQHPSGTDDVGLLPAEILVLALESCDLMFLWAEEKTGRVKFRHTSLRMPYGKVRVDRPGSLLAVDPCSRAIAVAYSEDKFIFYKVKPMQVWQTEIRAGRVTVPIKDELIISNPGRILQMDFLAPRSAVDYYHVVIVSVLAHGGRTKISCFDWDSRCDLESVAVRAERLSVDPEDHCPSLLIPMRHGPQFSLVFDRHISYYSDILSGTINHRIALPVPSESVPPLYPADSKSFPTFVQWHAAAGEDEFYIAREDGKILRMTYNPSSDMPELWEAGQLPVPVDKAFTTLRLCYPGTPRRYVFVATGVTSNGCVLKAEIDADGNSKISSKDISNWTPMNDLQAMAETDPALNNSEGHVLVGATGRAQNGTLAKFARSINIPIDDYAEHEGFRDCTALWVVHYGIDQPETEDTAAVHSAVLILNMPLETMLLRVTRRSGQWDLEQGDSESGNTGAVRLHETTLAAGIISENLAAQITQSEAILIQRPSLALVDSLQLTEKVFAATIASGIPYIAIACWSSQRPVLRVEPISGTGKFSSGFRYQLSGEPSCIQILEIYGEVYVFIGMTDSRVQFLRITPSSLRPCCEFDLRREEKSKTNNLAVCENATLLESEDARTLVCGTRDGLLISFGFTKDSSCHRLTFRAQVVMGHATVHVARSASDPSIAFIRCGRAFCRVDHRRPNTAAFSVDKLSLLDGSGAMQLSVSAFDQIPNSSAAEECKELAGYIFAVCGDRFLLARLEDDVLGSPNRLRRSEIVAIKTPVYSTPTKLFGLRRLPPRDSKLILASVAPTEVRPPPKAYRTLRSNLHIIDPHAYHFGDRNFPGSPSLVLKNYERVYSYAFETITNHKTGQQYEWLVVGTGVPEQGGRESGRKLYLRIEGGTLDRLNLKKEKLYNDPVRCVVLVPPCVCFTIHGSTLVVEIFSFDERRWQTVVKHTLPSPGVHATYCEHSHILYVSTAEHSHIGYRWEQHAETLKPFVPIAEFSHISYRSEHHAINKVLSDSRQRSLIHHLVQHLALKPTRIPGHVNAHIRCQCRYTVILLADKACTVAGLLWTRPSDFDTIKLHELSASEKAEASTITTAFEARLPRSVTRLVKGDFRPPWLKRSGGLPGGVLVDDIIGGCTDGTLYSFSILTSRALVLLKAIQNIIDIKVSRAADKRRLVCKRLPDRLYDLSVFPPTVKFLRPNPDLYRPETENTLLAHPPITRRQIDPGVGKHMPKKWHVDGDVLVRFLDGELYDLPWDPEHGLWVLLVDADVDREVLPWLIGLAREVGVFGEVAYPSGSESSSMEVDADPVNDVKAAKEIQEWIRDVTRDVL